MKERLLKLLSVKSLVTLAMTAALVGLLFSPNLAPQKELLALYCTSYGAIITYFFTRREDGDGQQK